MNIKLKQIYLAFALFFFVWLLVIIFFFWKKSVDQKYQEELALQEFNVGIVTQLSDPFPELPKGPYISIIRRGNIELGKYEHKVIWGGSAKGGGYVGELVQIGTFNKYWSVMTINDTKKFIPLFLPDFANLELGKVVVAYAEKVGDMQIEKTVTTTIHKGYAIAGIQLASKEAQLLWLSMSVVDEQSGKELNRFNFPSNIALPVGASYLVE